jgi:uncharacterized LabA/DUF88 family protein
MAKGQVETQQETFDRVIVYVDGFNLYYGLRDAGFRRYYWLDVHRLGRNLLKPGQSLVAVKYFTARISGVTRQEGNRAEVEGSRRRQLRYLEALESVEGLRVYEGHFLRQRQRCRRCGYEWFKPEEKMTDVCIATELLCDAFEDRFDTALLVSADSDLVPPIEAIRRAVPSKRVVVASPPRRQSRQLDKAASAHFRIGRSVLAKSQLPEVVRRDRGPDLKRPDAWGDDRTT